VVQLREAIDVEVRVSLRVAVRGKPGAIERTVGSARRRVEKVDQAILARAFRGEL
jgi:hypothetical protein